MLRPTGLSSSTPSPSSSTDLGFRFSQDDFLLKMPVRKSDSESFSLVFNSPNSHAPLLLAGGDASLGRRAAALHRRKPPGVRLRSQSGVLPERLDRPSHGTSHSPPSVEPQLRICLRALQNLPCSSTGHRDVCGNGEGDRSGAAELWFRALRH